MLDVVDVQYPPQVVLDCRCRLLHYVLALLVQSDQLYQVVHQSAVCVDRDSLQVLYCRIST